MIYFCFCCHCFGLVCLEFIELLKLWIDSFNQIWKLWAIILSNIFFYSNLSSLLGTLAILVLDQLILFTGHLGSYHFFPPPFSLISLNSLYCRFFNFTSFFPALSNLLEKHPVNFSIQIFYISVQEFPFTSFF